MDFQSFPLTTAALSRPQRNGGAANAKANRKESRDRLHKVLLASGDRREREHWAAHLSNSEYSLLSVEDGEAALQTILADRIDVVIAAVTMAKLDGLEMLRALRGLSRPPAAILVAKGGREIDRVYLKIAKLYGAAATYTQPLDRKTLRSGLRAALGFRDSSVEED